MRLTATFPTARAAQLMGTMAKHFAHKVPVEADDKTARIQFVSGVAMISLVDGALDLAVESDDPQGLVLAQDVLQDHLLRFAHRENPKPPQWTSVS